MNGLGVRELEREKLEKELDAVIDKSLIIVVAPSGYGKSTLIRQYFVKNPDMRNLWFPMQSEEVDANWIWHRICNKVREYNEPLYERVAQLGLPQSEQEIAYVIRMLNTYVVTQDYLVIDDYQECNSRWMDRLLENIALYVSNLHIILISRTYPDIPYEEMLLKGYCALVGQQNLTLNMEETQRIFSINDAELSSDELGSLYAYTDGWISAVYLSLYEYKKRGSFGNFLGVNRLLKTAIFDKFMPQLQQFFMRVSLFDWFELDGSRYVTKIDIDENLLFESQEQFGFFNYDPKSRSFQMHTLLRNVAKAELEKSGYDKKELYERAAQWCEKKKNLLEAVRYYKKSGNSGRIAQIYSDGQGRMLIGQAPELFEDIKDFIWEDIWNGNLMAWLNYLIFRVMRDRASDIKMLYENTIKELSTRKQLLEDKQIQAELLIIKAILGFNDIDVMNASLGEVDRLLENNTSSILGNSYLTYGTACMTLLFYRECGKLRETIEKEKIYARYYMNITKGVHEGWDAFFEAEYALMQGRFEDAYSLAEQVYKKNALRRQSCIVVSCYFIMLICLINSGKGEQFYKMLEDMKNQLSDIVEPVLIMDMELVQGYMYACLGMRDEMPDWLSSFKLQNCYRVIRSIKSGCMTYGRLLCAEKNWEYLDAVGDEMLVPFANTVHIYPVIVGYIYKSIAKYNLEQKEQAAQYLDTALQYAREDAVAQPFIENGYELKPIMQLLPEDEFLRSIKQRADIYEAGKSRILGRKAEGGKEPDILTKREAELMEYVKAGYKNSEISDKMHIAQVTVEKNLTSIYRKLGVKNRTAALRMLYEK